MYFIILDIKALISFLKLTGARIVIPCGYAAVFSANLNYIVSKRNVIEVFFSDANVQSYIHTRPVRVKIGRMIFEDFRKTVASPLILKSSIAFVFTIAIK